MAISLPMRALRGFGFFFGGWSCSGSGDGAGRWEAFEVEAARRGGGGREVGGRVRGFAERGSGACWAFPGLGPPDAGACSSGVCGRVKVRSLGGATSGKGGGSGQGLNFFILVVRVQETGYGKSKLRSGKRKSRVSVKHGQSTVQRRGVVRRKSVIGAARHRVCPARWGRLDCLRRGRMRDRA